MANTSEIPFDNENDDNSCSTCIKMEPLSMSNSKRSKANSSIKESTSETNYPIMREIFTIESPLNIHNQIHSKQKPFACDQCLLVLKVTC
jgi:hypothetical protein